MIRVLIVDDQDLMLQGLSMLVGKEENLEVVGSCHNGQEAVDYCKEHEVDLVLMDIRMPIMNGVEATKVIMNGSISVNKEIKIIILTTFTDDEYIFSSLQNGASGYLLKDAKPSEIISAIVKVYHGGTLINPDVATKVVAAIRKNAINKSGAPQEKVKSRTKTETIREDQEKTFVLENLTNREKDICHILAQGKNNKEIGQLLMIGEGTVKNNITRILDKLNMRDRTQLALFALKHKI